MKKNVILMVCLFAANILTAQNETRRDYVMVGSLEIYKKNGNPEQIQKVKIDKLSDKFYLEKVVGEEYKKSQKSDLPIDAPVKNNRIRDKIDLPGLELVLPDHETGLVDFHLKTPNFHIILDNGKEIYVGMSAEEIALIFPISFSQKAEIRSKNSQGSYTMAIDFASIIEGKLTIWDRWLEIVINKSSMKVEEIFTVEPD